MRPTIALCLTITAATLAFSYAHADRTQAPGFSRAGINRMASWDESQTILIAQGKPVDHGDFALRMRRLLPLALLKLWPSAWMALLMVVAGNLLLSVALVPLVARWWQAPLALLLPPLWWSSGHLLPTTLGLGLAILGWQSRNRWLLLGAGFVHEVFLAFSVAARKMSPVATWAFWVLVVSLSWGFSRGQFGVGALFGPYAEASWIHWLMISLTLALCVLTFRVDRVLGALYLLFAFDVGPLATLHWQDFTRLLAPVWVLGYVALVSWRTPASEEASQPTRSTRMPVAFSSPEVLRVAQGDRAFLRGWYEASREQHGPSSDA